MFWIHQSTVSPSCYYSTWMSAPHYRDPVVQAESLQRCVGFTVPQHHVEVALLMLRLRIRHSQFGRLLVLFQVLDLHVIFDALWISVFTKVHCVVVHGRHCEVPLHLLFIGETVRIVGREEVCV